MREIKFRAWSKRDQCWQGGFCIHYSGMVSTLISPDGNAHWDEDKDDLIIMQYIGRDDIHGTPIYEGDIVRMESGFTFLVDSLESAFDSDTYAYKLRECEVIGNLYENSDLIEKE